LLPFLSNSLDVILYLTFFSANSSAGAFFQWKQLGWYTVVNSSQRKQLGWRFLSVQTARLVHCSKLISVQTARLVLSFSGNSLADTCNKLISGQTAQLLLPFLSNSLDFILYLTYLSANSMAATVIQFR
jgi:hypothetical protein